MDATKDIRYCGNQFEIIREETIAFPITINLLKSLN